MPHFAAPAVNPLGNYDLRNGALWRVVTRSMPHYFAPDGSALAQSAFLKLDKELGFKLFRVQ